jgi:hypothetical protein
MKKIYSLLLIQLFNASLIFTMEILDPLVNELVKTIDYNPYHPCPQLGHTKDFIYNLSRVNKEFYQYFNNPKKTKTIIRKIADNYFTFPVAYCFSTKGTRNYVTRSAKLFNPSITCEELEHEVENGADVNYSRPYQWSLFSFFLLPQNNENKSIDKLQTLIKLGFDINIRSPLNGDTSLEFAIKNNLVYAIPLIIEQQPKDLCLVTAINHNPTALPLLTTPDNGLMITLDINDPYYQQPKKQLLQYFVRAGANVTPYLSDYHKTRDPKLYDLIEIIATDDTISEKNKSYAKTLLNQ